MIRPIIHRQLTRGDLACLVEEIARMDVTEGREGRSGSSGRRVDTVLDSSRRARGRVWAAVALPRRSHSRCSGTSPSARSCECVA